jgi:hypothetical protein
MADTVRALGQDVDQRAADELAGGKGHHLPSISAINAIILVAEGEATLVVSAMSLELEMATR